MERPAQRINCNQYLFSGGFRGCRSAVRRDFFHVAILVPLIEVKIAAARVRRLKVPGKKGGVSALLPANER
jgi:hypothetical protein